MSIETAKAIVILVGGIPVALAFAWIGVCIGAAHFIRVSSSYTHNECNCAKDKDNYP